MTIAVDLGRKATNKQTNNNRIIDMTLESKVKVMVNKRCFTARYANYSFIYFPIVFVFGILIAYRV